MRLRADDTALVLVDLQSSAVAMTPREAQALLTRNLQVTLDMAAALRLPVVVTSNLEDGPQGAVLEVIERSAPAAFAARIRRTGRFDAFSDPAFADAVAATGRRTLLIAGFPLDVPVTQTALSAVERGFAVAALVNCCGSPSRQAFDLSVQRLARGGVEPVVSISAMAEMAEGFDTPAGQAVFRIMIERVVMSDEGPLE